MRIFPELTKVDLQATATTSQRLAERARCSKETLAAATPLPAYVMEFQSVFTKEDFDILPEHRKWDHAIELIPRAEPKSSKVYSLSPLEQEELDTFLEENLYTGDRDQREFDLETRVTTNGNIIISEMFYSCALNK